MGQLMSSVGCGENKTAVQTLTQPKQLASSDDRPLSAISLVDVNDTKRNDSVRINSSDSSKSSDGVIDGGSNSTINNNSIFNKGENTSASSSGFGSKPPTPPEVDKPWGLSQPISFISGRIPSAYENIPTSDLGESLDVRRATQLFNKDNSAKMINSQSASPRELKCNFQEENPPPNSASFVAVSSHSACSEQSLDSGISDPGDEYSFVITENSPPDIVKKIEEEFTPVEDLNLTITGKACPRLLSGSQQTRLEEAAILESLRQEGFIATSKSKSAGGISFEVVEAASGNSSAGGTKPEDFLPQMTQKKLEERRAKFGPGDRNRSELLERWSGASQRRQVLVQAGQVLVQAGQVLVQAGQVLAQAGQVLVQAGQVLVQAGQVLVQAGQVLVQAGQVLVQAGQVLVQAGQAELAARQEKMAELIKGSEAEKQRLEELARKQESKTDAALAKREEHLKGLRDKLKQQNQRAQHVKLKKIINGPPVPVPLVRATSDYGSHRALGHADLFFN
ncbi:hypothetical protein FHG87_010928 [Trinorchestia longiramus]|nr:hypothetical protein FHG87_010928 [Trinorchestia longiramus]